MRTGRSKHHVYEHIPGHWAPQLNDFHRDHFNPYINFHRPCLFPVPHIDPKGKVKKRYPYEEMNTPYDKLKSLPKANRFLRPGSPSSNWMQSPSLSATMRLRNR